jgi:hypothetical protein
MLVAIFVTLASVGSGLVLSNLRILILLSAVALAGAFIVTWGTARSESFFAIALVFVIASAGLQLGYLVGMAIVAFWPAGDFAITRSLKREYRPHDRFSAGRRAGARLAGREIR